MTIILRREVFIDSNFHINLENFAHVFANLYDTRIYPWSNRVVDIQNALLDIQTQKRPVTVGLIYRQVQFLDLLSLNILSFEDPVYFIEVALVGEQFPKKKCIHTPDLQLSLLHEVVYQAQVRIYDLIVQPFTEPQGAEILSAERLRNVRVLDNFMISICIPYLFDNFAILAFEERKEF